MNRVARRQIVAALVMAVALSAGERSLHAQTESGVGTAAATPTPQRDRVVVRIVADEGEGTPFEASLRELLGRLGLTIDSQRVDARVTEPTPDARTLAVVWVDLKASARATTTIADARTNRAVVSREVTRDRSPAIVGDEIAHIVYGAVEELAQIERERERTAAPPNPRPPEPGPAPLPAPEPSPAPAREPEKVAGSMGFDGGAFAVGRALGSDANLAVGGGALVGWGFTREGIAPSLWLSGAYHAPVDAKSDLVDAHVNLLSLRLAPTIALARTSRWRLEVGPEGGVDVSWSSTTSDSLPRSRLSAERQSASPMLGVLAMSRFAVAPTADVFLAATVDADLSPDRYVIREGGRSEVVFETWRVRPALAFGFTFSLAGPPLYASQSHEARR